MKSAVMSLKSVSYAQNLTWNSNLATSKELFLQFFCWTLRITRMYLIFGEGKWDISLPKIMYFIFFSFSWPVLNHDHLLKLVNHRFVLAPATWTLIKHHILNFSSWHNISILIMPKLWKPLWDFIWPLHKHWL